MPPTTDTQPGLAENAALVLRLIAGEPTAFSEAYAQYKGVVYGFLVRLSGDRSVAADLFQNTWLALARTAPRLREDSHLRAWLLTVARRQYLSFRRAEALDVSRWCVVHGEDAQVVWPDSDLGGRDLAKALAKLTDADRELILLSAMEDLNACEVAKILEVTPVAVRQRLCRARRRLEGWLLEAWSGQPGKPEKGTA